MASEDDDRLIDQTHQRVARVGQGNAIADAGAVQLFPFLQGAYKRLSGVGPVGDFGDFGDQFVENFVALATGQAQLDGVDSDQIADQQPERFIRSRHNTTRLSCEASRREMFAVAKPNGTLAFAVAGAWRSG